MSRQWKRQAGVAAVACATAFAAAGCNTTEQSAAAANTSSTVTGSSGQGTIVGGVNAAGSAVVSGVTTVGGAVVSPFLPGSYNNWSYTDANGVVHRYDRFGYYDANGTYIPYDNGRGAYCAKWDPLTNSCIWWLTG